MAVLKDVATEVIEFEVKATVTAWTESIDAAAVVDTVDVVLVGSCAAASVATLPVSVVDALGTAVHRLP